MLLRKKQLTSISSFLLNLFRYLSRSVVSLRRNTVGRAHQYLLGRVTWYSQWHKHPHHRKIHYSAVALTCLLVASSIITTLFPNPSGVEAAVATWDFSHDNTKYDYDASKITMAGGNATLTNPGSATGASTNINAGGGATGNASAAFASANKEYLTVTSNSSVQAGDIDFEIGGWVRLDTLSSYQVIARKAGEYNLYIGTGLAYFSVIGEGQYPWVASTTFGNLGTNTWYFIRGWRVKSENKIYISVNGVTNSNTLAIIPGTAANALMVGTESTTAGYINGRLDSLYFQKRISTTDEATSLYNGGSGRSYGDLNVASGLATFKSGLTSWWDLNEESGTRLDSFGSNHLTSAASPIIAPPSYGTEKIVNPGFETAGGGGADVFGTWTETPTDGAITDETIIFHSGGHAAKLTRGTDITSVNQTIAVTAGVNYYYSFWSAGDGTNAGRYFIQDVQNTTYLINGASTNNKTTTYQLFTGQLTAPAGCTSIKVYVAAPAVNGGIAYFDDVSVKQINTAAINNGGFDDRPATGGQSTNVSSVSVARSTNVATIVATNHGLKNNDVVTTTGFTDTSFNATNKTVTVVDVNTFTFASSGTDKTTTADTGGRIATDVFSGLNEFNMGASTITAETATPYSGSYAAKLSVDAGDNYNYISQDLLIANKKYSINVWAKVSDITSAPGIIMYSSGSGGVSQTFNLTTVYSNYTGTIAAAGATLYIQRKNPSSSKSIYIDQLTLTSQGPTVEVGITANSTQEGNFAAQFNGTNQYLSLADATGTSPLNPGLGNFSISGSIYLDKLTAVTKTIIYKGSGSGGVDGYWVYISSNNKFGIQFCDGSAGVVSAEYTSVLSVSTWYNFVINFTRNGNAQLFINNVSDGNISIAAQQADNAGTSTLLVGGSGATFFPGRLDNIGFMRRVLTTNEIASLNNNGKGLKYAQLPESINSNIAVSMPNSDFETAGAGGFDTWVEGAAGTSTINNETSSVHGGGHALRFDIDGSGSGAQVYQPIMTVGKRYKATFWAKSSSGTANLSTTSGAGSVANTINTTYSQYTANFTASTVNFGLITSTTSKSVYVDDITLEEVPLISYWNLDDKSGVRYDSVTTMANNLSDNGTVTQAQGVNYYEGAVASLLDNSGNNNTFTQTTLSKRPVYSQVGIGNKASMLFDGVDDSLFATGDKIGTGDVTITTVIKPRGWGGVSSGFIVYNTQSYLRMDNTTSKIAVTSDNGITKAYSGIIALNTDYIITVTRTSLGVVNIYINGALSGGTDQASGTTFVGSDTVIGNRAAGDRAFDGNIGTVQIYNGILDPLHRNNLEKSLGEKYGIAVTADSNALSSSAASSMYPTISLNQPLQYATISSFTPALSGSSTGTPRYQLTTDGTSAAGSGNSASYYYHNGTNWVSANKYNAYQSNTSAEVNASIATLKDDVPSGGANYLKWRAFLITDGIDNPSITSINSNYISDTKAPLNPTTLTSTITPLDSNTPQAISTNEWHNSTTLHLTWPASRNSNEPETDQNRGGAIDQINENEIYSGVSSYNLYFGEDPSADPTTTSGLINTNSSPHNQATTTIDLTNLPLETGKTYYFLIETKDVAGNIAHINQRAAEEPPVLDTPLLTYKYDSEAPTPLEYVQVAQVGCSTSPTFDLTWPASTDSLSGLKYYQYKVGVNGTVNTTTATTITVAPERENENVFYVRPVDNANNSNPTQANTIWQSTVFCSTQSVTLTSGPTYTKTLSTLTVDFETSRPTTSKVEVYKIKEDESLEKVSTGEDTTLSLTHSVIVPNLTPDTNYKYKLFFKDQNNNEGESNYYEASTDLISLSHTTTNNLENSLSSLTIIFETTKPARARVEVYKDTNKQQEVSTQDYTLNHHLTINNLTSGTTYTYKIFYIDQENNNYESSTYTTTTTTVGIVDLPTITSGPNSVNIIWKTNLPTTGQVQIKEGDTYKEPQGHITYLTDHNVTIQGLKSEKPYKLRIIWTDESNKTDQTGWFEANTASAPMVSKLRVEVISPTKALVSWETNYLAESTIGFGLGNYSKEITLENVGKNFSKTLENLESGSNYSIRIMANSEDGAQFYAADTFQTPPLPSISALRFEPLKDSSHATYKAFWTTNIETSSAIYYKVQGSGEYKSKASAELTKEHEILLDSMEDQSSYELYAQGADKYGNVTKSDLNTIKTPNDSRPPKITNLSTSVKSSGFADNQKAQVIVTWDTDELSTSQVEYANGIEGTEYQNRTKEETALSTSHVVVISDLEPSKIYHLRAISKDQANNPAYSQDTTVITGKVQKSVLDIILASLQRSLGWITKLFK